MFGHDGIGFYAACDACRKEFFREDGERHYDHASCNQIAPDLNRSGWVVIEDVHADEQPASMGRWEKYYCPDCKDNELTQRLRHLEHMLWEVVADMHIIAMGAGATAMPFDVNGLRRVANISLRNLDQSLACDPRLRNKMERFLHYSRGKDV